ncbi:MAG: protein TolQ [Desulfurivibrionaceae bacterium]|nr:protein TolQ [Desulfobulbales bacterium]MDT8334087.1 protein TolQ [Desulfurivibrionaceae bacterium]
MDNLSLFAMFWHAGAVVKFVMLLLLFFSLGSWYIIFNRYLRFKNTARNSADFLKSFWNCKSLSEVNQSIDPSLACPEYAIFKSGYKELQKIIKSKPHESDEKSLAMRMAGVDNLKRCLQKAETTTVNELSRNLAFLATTGSATPFIGLFGTVWGIMASFHEIGKSGSASLAVVAPGISEALVATAAGLAVAIPAVIFYNYFSNRVAEMESEMQSFSADFMNLIERDLISRA